MKRSIVLAMAITGLTLFAAACNNGSGGDSAGGDESSSNWDSAESRLQACFESTCTGDEGHFACQYSAWAESAPPEACDGLWESFVLSHAEDDCEMILNGYTTARQLCVDDHGG